MNIIAFNAVLLWPTSTVIEGRQPKVAVNMFAATRGHILSVNSSLMKGTMILFWTISHSYIITQKLHHPAAIVHNLTLHGILP